MRLIRSRTAIVAQSIALLLIAPSMISAQAGGEDEAARRAWTAARGLALAGRADSALAQYQRAAVNAERAGDSRMVAAALVGAAQVHAVHVGCNDSATVLFRQAVAKSEAGDRVAADAFVRYLATKGQTAEAQKVLNEAYASTEGLGRSITRESLNWYQGMAAIQRGSGQEAAALASLTSALNIAARLRAGDVSDTVAKPTGEVDPINYWVVYDVAQLRLNAKARAVANPATGKKLMDALVTAGIGLDERDELVIPVARLFDTLTLRTHQCRMNGGTCASPTLARCAGSR